MKCASIDCSCEELTATDPCVVCGRGVHHICSNELYDSGALSERFCSASCLYQYKTVPSPPLGALESGFEAQEMPSSSSQVSQFSDSQDSLLPVCQSAHPASPSDSPTSVVDLTSTSVVSNSSSGHSTRSSTSSGVDVYGIPLEIIHFRQQNSRHEVWEMAHRLATPVSKTTGQDMEPFTHICLLCAQQLTCNTFAGPSAWEGALHRWSNTSNVKSHMISLHDDHPLGMAEASLKLKTATRHVDDVMERTYARESKRTIPTTMNDRAYKRRGALQKLWVPTQREIGIYIAHWLINAGLPYNTVVSEDFKLLVQRLTGDSDANILAAATFRDILEALYTKFCDMVKLLLLREFEAAYGLPFLNLHHDGWTTGNGESQRFGYIGFFYRCIMATPGDRVAANDRTIVTFIF